MTDPTLRIGKSALEAVDEKVKALTNKLANAETPGFKSSDVLVRSFPLELQAAEKRMGYQSEEPKVDGTIYSHVRGSLIRTANPTDLALGADGFFTILGSWGEGYSRDGRFTVDPEGRLVTTVGNYPVLGRNGPIVVTPGSQVEVSSIGEIKVGDTLVDTLRVVDFANKDQLVSINGVIFKNTNSALQMTEVVSPRIVQGYVEASNVSVVDSMMEMIYLSRLYTLDTKIVSTRENILTQAVSLGKTQ